MNRRGFFGTLFGGIGLLMSTKLISSTSKKPWTCESINVRGKTWKYVKDSNPIRISDRDLSIYYNHKFTKAMEELNKGMWERRFSAGKLVTDVIAKGAV